MVKERIFSFLIDFGILIILLLCSELLPILDVRILMQLLLFVLFFCRDSITGQSIGRRILGICVMYRGKQIGPLQAFVRNLLLIIWPIELIVLLTGRKRFGDLITASEVDSCPSARLRLSWVGVLLVFLLWIGLSGLWFGLKTDSPMLMLLNS